MCTSTPLLAEHDIALLSPFIPNDMKNEEDSTERVGDVVEKTTDWDIWKCTMGSAEISNLRNIFRYFLESEDDVAEAKVQTKNLTVDVLTMFAEEASSKHAGALGSGGVIFCQLDAGLTKRELGTLRRRISKFQVVLTGVPEPFWLKSCFTLVFCSLGVSVLSYLAQMRHLNKETECHNAECPKCIMSSVLLGGTQYRIRRRQV